MAAAKVHSEDVLGEKWDRCVADTILKTSERSLFHDVGNVATAYIPAQVSDLG